MANPGATMPVDYELLTEAAERLSDVEARSGRLTGAGLKYAREALGLSRSDAALMLGYSSDHLEKLEACKFACGFTRRALLTMLVSRIKTGAAGTC